MGIRIPQSLRRTFSAVEKSYLIPAMAGILIGGESRRFGSPKWKAEIDSVPVLERLWKTCDGFESRIVIGKNKPRTQLEPAPLLRPPPPSRQTYQVVMGIAR